MSNGIDELLRNYRGRVLTYHELFKKQHHNPLRLDEDLAHADAVAKQAILRWVADEVIGEDDNVRLEHSDSAMTKKGERNWVRHEQRKILAKHGYKGDQR